MENLFRQANKEAPNVFPSHIVIAYKMSEPLFLFIFNCYAPISFIILTWSFFSQKN